MLFLAAFIGSQSWHLTVYVEGLNLPETPSMPGIKDAKTILIIGATAGIGRSLAYAIHDLPTEPTVIVAGRRQDRIDEITQKSGRFGGITVDLLAGREALKKFTEDVIVQWPEVCRLRACTKIGFLMLTFHGSWMQ